MDKLSAGLTRFADLTRDGVGGEEAQDLWRGGLRIADPDDPDGLAGLQASVRRASQTAPRDRIVIVLAGCWVVEDAVGAEGPRIEPGQVLAPSPDARRLRREDDGPGFLLLLPSCPPASMARGDAWIDTSDGEYVLRRSRLAEDESATSASDFRFADAAQEGYPAGPAPAQYGLDRLELAPGAHRATSGVEETLIVQAGSLEIVEGAALVVLGAGDVFRTRALRPVSLRNAWCSPARLFAWTPG